MTFSGVETDLEDRVDCIDSPEPLRHDEAPFNRLMLTIRAHARLVNVSVFYCLMMALFIVLEPDVFLNPRIYTAVFTTVPFLIILTVPAVFVIVGGELDLSFPSVFAAAAGIFAYGIDNGLPFLACLLAALVVGAIVGLANGLLVVNIGLSSLVATLGMNFLVRGATFVVSDGRSRSVSQLRDTTGESILIGKIGSFPVQMIWAIALAGVGVLLFTRHRFGMHVRCVGDNSEAAAEMGISVGRIRTLNFIYMGASAALAGVMSTLALATWFPGSGDGYLLLVLAAVFVGGTPTWGGVGTVAGGAIGALVIGFAETGIVTIGLTGFYTQLIFGLIIILSLAGQRILPAAGR